MTKGPEVGYYPEGEPKKLHPLVKEMIEDSIHHLPTKHEKKAEKMIENGLINRFQKYIEESENVQLQKQTPEYIKHTAEQKSYGDNAEEGSSSCSDGRNDGNYIMGPAEEVKPYRTPGGVPKIRLDNGIPILDMPETEANIETAFAKKKGSSIKELVEYLQMHGITTHPDHGCGYLTGLTKAAGHIPEIGMRLGGIPTFMQVLNPEYITAFNNSAERVGGRGTTFLMFVDHFSQGLITLPYNIHEQLDHSKSLLANFNELHDKKVILMNERLDDKFHQQIIDLAKSMGSEGKINTRDYTKLIVNLILVGKVAREITLEQEKLGFPFIPESILTQANATETARKLLGFRIVRNITERVLSGRENGNHDLMKHPEQFVRVGSVGAENNSVNVPFVQKTAGKSITDDDIRSTKALYDILTDTLPKRPKDDADLQNEGRVILVAGEIEEDDYKASAFQKHLTLEESFTRNNAAKLRDSLADSVSNGETVVVGGIFDGKTKVMKHAVTG